ncbi:MAG: Crp/Fnr family transcriptional regulator [Spirochaetales bacterium]|nr:Crp/Fnr family transcriptional regulator [Spirochaetales bacterium]
MIEKLAKNVFFRGVSYEDTGRILEETPVSVLHFDKDELILRQGEPYEGLYLLLEGRCISRMTDYRGRELKIEHFEPGAALAPAVLFATANDMPGSVIATSRVEAAVLSRDAVLTLCGSYRRVQENLLTLLSDKFMFISKRFEMMSFRTIREKLANYLLSLKAREDGTVVLPLSIEELSAFFAVSRPSLSRVFSILEEEGIIEKTQRSLRIIDIDALIRDAPDE